MYADTHKVTDIDVQDGKGSTALHRAWSGWEDKVQSLLNNGADMNAKDHRGYTPLYEAVDEEHLAIISQLIKHGADMNITNKDGETVIQRARRYGDTNVVEAITKAIEASAQAE